jgi:uncharacterized membrane protein (UPF0127 family)
MFRRLDRALVFVWWRTGSIAITNLFVPAPIDVAWLDERLRVVAMTPSFPAWSLRTVNDIPARYVLELPAGTLIATGTRQGDRLGIEGLDAPNVPLPLPRPRSRSRVRVLR